MRSTERIVVEIERRNSNNNDEKKRYGVLSKAEQTGNNQRGEIERVVGSSVRATLAAAAVAVAVAVERTLLFHSNRSQPIVRVRFIYPSAVSPATTSISSGHYLLRLWRLPLPPAPLRALAAAVAGAALHRTRTRLSVSVHRPRSKNLWRHLSNLIN